MSRVSRVRKLSVRVGRIQELNAGATSTLVTSLKGFDQLIPLVSVFTRDFGAL